MKFSILALLAFTGYVALVMAGLQDPESWWRQAGTIAWLLALAYFFVLAVDSSSIERAVFGRVCLACIASYFLLAWMKPEVSNRTQEAEVLPHRIMVQWWINWHSRNPSATKGQWETAYQAQPAGISPAGMGQSTWLRGIPIIRAMAVYNFALVFGIMGGTLALWTHRRRVRREQREKAASRCREC